MDQKAVLELNRIAAMYRNPVDRQELHAVPLQLGKTTNVSRAFARVHARALFADALYELVPDLTDDLLTEKAFELLGRRSASARGWEESLKTWHERDGSVEGLVSLVEMEDVAAASRAVVEADTSLQQHIYAWKRKHNLMEEDPEDRWIAEAAHRTLVVAAALEEAGHRSSRKLDTGDPGDYLRYEGKDTSGVDVLGRWARGEAHLLLDVPVFLDDLRNSPESHPVGVLEDDGEIGVFDARSENIGDVADRIVAEELRPRLMRRLQAIADDDRNRNDAVLPKGWHKRNSFEWLVRHQVLGESKSQISKADGIDRAGVSKAVNQTAELIGLERREDDEGGRPRKSRKNTKRVR